MYFNDEKKKTNIDLEFNKKKKINIKYILIFVLCLIVIVIGIIVVKKISHKEYYLLLNGSNDMVIRQNSFYEDAGFKAYDNKGNELNELVFVDGYVDTNVIGEYKITYTLHNIVRERVVTVIPDMRQITYLMLSGPSVIFLKVNDEYIEPGYNVLDNQEDDIHEKVKIEGNVDTKKSGAYKIIYSVTNKSGEVISKERTVIVTDSDIDISYSPLNITNNDVTINIKVDDNYFDYILMPDNKKNLSRNVTYQVSKNGIYKFIVYSKDGSYKEQEIEINNIDKEGPSGICSGVRQDGSYNIQVFAKDNLAIENYNYYFNNKLVKTDTKSIFNYQSGLMDDVYVIVNDKAGNSKKINCEVEKRYNLEIHFIDVGREDAILVRSNEATIFIDGGTYKNHSKILPYLKDLGIKKIDAIIGSHLHHNHIQAQGAIIDNYPVGRVYYGQDLYTCNPTYCSDSGQRYVLDAIKRHNIPQVIMKEGDHIVIGDITIDCYSPITFQTKKQNQYAENYNSLNFVLTYENNKFMFTGDYMQSSNILKKYQKELMDIDLLKYPHHGQANVGKEMAFAMSPKYVIVTNNEISSLKKRNEYRYFNEMKSEIYYSGKHNNILVTSDGNNLMVKTDVNSVNYKR